MAGDLHALNHRPHRYVHRARASQHLVQQHKRAMSPALPLGAAGRGHALISTTTIRTYTVQTDWPTQPRNSSLTERIRNAQAHATKAVRSAQLPTGKRSWAFESIAFPPQRPAVAVFTLTITSTVEEKL